MTTADESYVVQRYGPSDSDRWDEFVMSASNGTFLHTRRYLSYHGSRFDDVSLIVVDRGDTIVAVLPAARAADTSESVVASHPGLTFGGLVHSDRLRGDRLIASLASILRTFRELGFDTLDYRPVPPFARRRLGNEDVYAAYRLGAVRSTCHLAAVVDLDRRPVLTGKKRNMLRKADREGIELHEGAAHLSGVWDILTEQLARRYDASPVHTFAEIKTLAARFPDAIQCHAATNASGIVAGAVVYRYSPDAVHTQYLTSNEAGRQAAALDLLCEAMITEATAQGDRFFSFGPSTLDGGSRLNDSLYRFKSSFGAEGVALESYRISCRVP